MKIPRWLKIQERVDLLIFELSSMLNSEQKLSVIEKMIDKATGMTSKKLEIAKRKIREVKKLIKEYNNL